MTLRYKLQLVVMADDEEMCVEEIVVLDKQHERLEHLGLSLADVSADEEIIPALTAEAKALLVELRRQILTRQVAAFLAAHVPCPSCSRARGIKDRKSIVFRTLFGSLKLASPRLRRCPCQHDGRLSASPLVELLTQHTAPEVLYLESKWSSSGSYGLTVRAVRDFLPVDAKLNATTVRRQTLRVARRCEADLRTQGEANVRRSRSGQHAPAIVAIVGTSVPTNGEARCFGFVQSQDAWPRRRLAALLQAQGASLWPQLTFLSDGEDSMRSLQRHLSPRAQHLLDWFHLAVRLQRLHQLLVGLTHLDDAVGTAMQSALARTKWSLWHGKPRQAFARFQEVEWRIYGARWRAGHAVHQHALAA
jgi:hypothetical protein